MLNKNKVTQLFFFVFDFTLLLWLFFFKIQNVSSQLFWIMLKEDLLNRANIYPSFTTKNLIFFRLILVNFQLYKIFFLQIWKDIYVVLHKSNQIAMLERKKKSLRLSRVIILFYFESIYYHKIKQRKVQTLQTSALSISTRKLFQHGNCLTT